MLVLTDCPNELGNALPIEPSWKLTEVASQDLPDRSIWSAVSPRSAAYAWSAGERFRIGGLRRMVVIGDAPQSQFASLVNALGSGAALPDGSAVLALQGRGFQGQRGRPWTALRGNIHLCVYYRAGVNVDRIGMGLTMLPAVAVIDAVNETCADVDPGIKWVNDILIDGKKVAGVLTSTLTRERLIEHVVFGIGVNVGAAPDIDPTPFVPAAGCLAESADVQWPAVLFALLNAVDRRFRDLIADGPNVLLDLYRAHSVIVGERVRIWAEPGRAAVEDLRNQPAPVAGLVEAIREDLSLQIRGVNGVISTGRLALENACRDMGL